MHWIVGFCCCLTGSRVKRAPEKRTNEFWTAVLCSCCHCNCMHSKINNIIVLHGLRCFFSADLDDLILFTHNVCFILCNFFWCIFGIILCVCVFFDVIFHSLWKNGQPFYFGLNVHVLGSFEICTNFTNIRILFTRFHDRIFFNNCFVCVFLFCFFF